MLAALGLLMPTAALAAVPNESGVVERAPHPAGWIAFGDGVIVMTGPELDAAGCLGQIPQQTATYINPPSDVSLVHASYVDEIRVFDDQGYPDALAWLFGFACPPLLAGESGPEPIAQGEGRVTWNYRVDADGVLHGRVSTTATVTTTDGSDVHLNTFGEIGASTDFVNYGG